MLISCPGPECFSSQLLLVSDVTAAGGPTLSLDLPGNVKFEVIAESIEDKFVTRDISTFNLS